MTSNLDIKHDGNRFFVEVEGHTVSVDYEMNGNVMDITHTYSPPELRGRGLAEEVTKAAFEYAKEHELKIIPSCSYTRLTFIPKHGEYASLVAEE